jgi:hypothetical protein
VGREAPVPFRKLAAGLDEAPAAEAPDQPGLLGERDELSRWDEAVARVLPARERLEALDLARRERQRRLVVELELVVRDRLAQLGLELQPLDERDVQARVVAS